MIDNRTVGKTIATLRQAHGLTQQQLAAAMNVSHQAVSKWENGAALPDIQTMVELTQLFGITVEQLLSGEIPEERFEDDRASNDPIENIGKFFNGVINDIGNRLKPEKKEFVETELVDQSDEEPQDEKAEEQTVDLKKLLQMAPFMSKSTLEEMIRKSGRKLTATEIARFAPFLDSVFLEELIHDSEGEISWDTLRRVAPFLKREMVDAFARTIALGEKYVRPASQEVNRATEDVCKTIDEVSRKIGKGMDRAVRKVARLGENVVNEVTKAFDNLAVDSEYTSREERIAKLRRNAFERAMDDNRWDWIEAHIHEIPDDDLKLRIIGRAQERGMGDWLNRNFGCEDAAEIDQAIEEGKWEWLGERIRKFDSTTERKVLLAAAAADQWDWLEEISDEIDMLEIAPQIASAARKAGERMFAVKLTRCNMMPEQAEQLVIEALEERDLEFADMVLDLLSQDALYRCCAFSAKSDDWDTVMHFAGKLDCDSVEMLLQIAIDSGNFDAIDLLDTVFSEKMKEEID